MTKLNVKRPCPRPCQWPESGPSTQYKSELVAPFKMSQVFVKSFTHLKHMPRADRALPMLQGVASLVKPIMRKHGWTLPTLAEFFPESPNLLGECTSVSLLLSSFSNLDCDPQGSVSAWPVFSAFLSYY